MRLDNFPDHVIKMYNLMDKVDAKGFVILQKEKGMYGLPYAGILSDMTPGFWPHNWRPFLCILIVGVFGVKYVRKKHANHLISVLEEHCMVKHIG